MPRGWLTESEWNKKVYKKWQHMLERVYSEKYMNKKSTYINCTCQLEWHWLSYFAEHFKEIDGYDEQKFLNGELELDKDIKSNGMNKEYSINNCILVSRTDNSKQAIKTRDNTYLQGENHHRYGKGYTVTGENNPMYGKHHSEETKQKIKVSKEIKVNQYTKNNIFIKTWDSMIQAERELNISHSSISACCKRKLKTAGGFIWKYYEEDK